MHHDGDSFHGFAPSSRDQKRDNYRSTMIPSLQKDNSTPSFAAIQRQPFTAMPTKKKASKREVIQPNKADRRYVRRKGDGTFGKTVDTGKSLATDQRSKAKKTVPKGQGDRGDTKKKNR
jgi:hypothetical protein